MFGTGRRLHLRTIEVLLVTIVEAVHKMHLEKYSHCGLREDAIYLTDGLYPIISEFQSTLFCTYKQAADGKLALRDDGYTPPELLGKGTVPKALDLRKVDSYSVGVILIHMLAGKKDYPRVEPDKIGPLPEPEGQEEKNSFARLSDLASQLVKYWPKARLDLAEVVKLDWFRILRLKVYGGQTRRLLRFDILERKDLLPEEEKEQLREDLRQAMVEVVPLPAAVRDAITQLEQGVTQTKPRETPK